MRATDPLVYEQDSPNRALVVLDAGTVLPARASTPLPAELLAGIAQNQTDASAENTRRAYESDWAAFKRWCDAHGQIALPAASSTVAAYITDRAALVDPAGDPAYAPSTIARWVTSINASHERAGHPAPGGRREVKDTLAGIRRRYVRPTRRMAPLLLADLKKVLTAIDINSYPAGIIGHRDSAMLLMGFAGAFRRSELAIRRVGDVSLHSEDGLHVRVLTAKTDQEGRGSVKGLPFGENPLTCPPCAYLRWARVLEVDQGGQRSAMMRLLRDASSDEHVCHGPTPWLSRLDPKTNIFRPVRRGGHIGLNAISGEVVNAVVKRRLAAVGMNPSRFGGHSLRAGFVTQALRAGASPFEIMPQTDHKNIATVEVYRREHDPLRGNAVTRLGL
jgi:integrase